MAARSRRVRPLGTAHLREHRPVVREAGRGLILGDAVDAATVRVRVGTRDSVPGTTCAPAKRGYARRIGRSLRARPGEAGPDEQRTPVRYHTRWLDEDQPRTIPVPIGFRPPAPHRRPTRLAPVPPGARCARLASPRKTGTPAWVAVAYAASAVIVVVGAVAGPGSGTANVSGAPIITPIVFGITMMIARRLAEADENPQVVPIIMGGFCLKVVGSVLKFSVSSNVYGTGDFFDYDKWGRRIASGSTTGTTSPLPGRFAGTNFIRLVTGIIYTVSPVGDPVGLHRLRLAELHRRPVLLAGAYRIALLSSATTSSTSRGSFSSATLIYWPSSIGKDAWMVFTMGIASYGAACLFAHRLPRGIIATTIGIAGMCMVRPHIALVACGGLILAVLFRRNRGGGSRILSILFVVLATLVVVRVASSFFGIQAFNRTSIQAQINDTSAHHRAGRIGLYAGDGELTARLPARRGDRAVSPVPVRGALGPGDDHLDRRCRARGPDAPRRPPILASLRRSRDYPYFMYALGAMLVFIVAFSGFSNFGLLARERAVIQPLFFVFLTLPENIEAEFPKWQPEPLAVPDFRR